MKKILVISSPGGHWVQLCRLIPALKENTVVYACTYERPTEIQKSDTYHKIEDISRDSIGRLPSAISNTWKIIKDEKPDIIITTGALPGLLAIAVGRLRRTKTIWLDSIANSEQVSMSGRIASYCANECYTQWSNLTNKRIKYIGRVI